ncbi:hypothetical protein PPERSA_03518 [Pseudocohnilembus persalinus]|uniref:JmjC domain-containing protein n=1 Tax=Pseudocohnilembus persalinus TaxID=266149 RepID=A0A0V0R294_PSEPJ|nr:hypothetical protein PPERSA_03518 [Pseudocohnilembus persalinus]|eukprot:KRX08647.1 hypothetical protein PPERSA_03518 [Pseudocohnilembus persalinus]
MCDCYCSSKDLYRNSNKQYQLLQGGKFTCDRKFENFYDPRKTGKFTKIFNSSLEVGEITFPQHQIEEIDFQEIIDNPIFFYKDFVVKNKPAKILNAINDWPALENWADINYVKEKMKSTNEQKITVDITPDGFADSVHGEYFCQPWQEQMSFKEFLKLEDDKNLNDFVPYIQKQNGNLDSEFEFLYQDISDNLQNIGSNKFFDKQPDASNFWMGHGKSVSAMHKDHYENFYAVLTGEKHFTLAPPEVYPFLGNSQFINGYWNYDKEKSEFYLDLKNQSGQNNNNQEKIQWTGLNIDLDLDRQKFPYLKDIPQYHVVLKPGEVLYLPAIWYHQVAQEKQSQNTSNHDYITAVNFWYDMQFDQKYRCYQLINDLVNLTNGKLCLNLEFPNEKNKLFYLDNNFTFANFKALVQIEHPNYQIDFDFSQAKSKKIKYDEDSLISQFIEEKQKGEIDIHIDEIKYQLKNIGNFPLNQQIENLWNQEGSDQYIKLYKFCLQSQLKSSHAGSITHFVKKFLDETNKLGQNKQLADVEIDKIFRECIKEFSDPVKQKIEHLTQKKNELISQLDKLEQEKEKIQNLAEKRIRLSSHFCLV